MQQTGLSIEELHIRYSVQARWTAALRRHLLKRAQISPSDRVLDVGSGTGVVAAESKASIGARIVALDLDPEALRFSRQLHADLAHIAGDGFQLPFRNGCFALAYCHFLLMWTPPPESILREMRRVVRPAGWVMALAEPDYGGRLDFPHELESLGAFQTEALRLQGADPVIGRRLRHLLVEAGLENVRGGVLGGEWADPPDPAELDSEWRTLTKDLAGRLSLEALARYRQVDSTAWNERRRVLFVPTFYAAGRVPQIA